MFLKLRHAILIFLVSFTVSSFTPKNVFAQFTGDLGLVSGSVTWGSDTITGEHRVAFQNTEAGFSLTATVTGNGSYNTDFSLPPGTYTVTPKLKSNNSSVGVISLTPQSVTVSGGQSTVVNFDAQSETGLIKGSISVNGQPDGGEVQICSPGGPCSFQASDGPLYGVGSSFDIALLPGNYVIHAQTNSRVDLGAVPVVVVAGQIISDTSVQFSINLGSVAGSLQWGGNTLNGANSVYLQNTQTGFSITATVLDNGAFNTSYALPPGAYTVTPRLRSNQSQSGAFNLTPQTVTVSGGQSTVVNFDAQSETGLIKGSFSVNGQPDNGEVQICSPGGPCSFQASDGPFYGVGSSFNIALLPGNYIVHARNHSNIDLGSVPITVIAGEMLSDASLQFSINLGAVSGTLQWGTELMVKNEFDRIYFQNMQTGFIITATVLSNGTFNTDFSLPSGAYRVTPELRPTNTWVGAFNLSPQMVTVNGSQTTTVNFDAQSETGLIKGSISVNGQPDNGEVQFCSLGGPCSFQTTDGPLVGVGSNFSIALLPGNYIVHARNHSNVDLGSIPITVIAGEIINLITTSVSVPTGQNVTVSLAGVNIAFTEVTNSGFMSVTSTTHPQGGQAPSQYRFLGTYYELATTATYSGPITVSFTYNDSDVHGQESNLKLFHWDGTTWNDITVSVDTVNNIITGSTTTLSPFAIGDLLNSPPTVDAGGPYQIDEGGSVQLSASGNDPENGTLTYAWDLDNDGVFETFGQNVNFSAVTLDGPSSYTVKVQVSDDGGLTAIDEATVEVTNESPSLDVIVAPVDPVAVNTSINTSVDFTDPGLADTFTADWDWGVGTISNGTIAGGTVTGSHTYTSAGVYTINVTVTDDDGGSTQQTFQFVVVYNPDGGFVTGGGWIDSPSGAYASNPTLTGKANFGFVSKYEHGATVPTGQTKFQFKVGDLNFDSTDYDWLVVAGPNAKYKGSGTINGEGDYGFMLTARDGQANGGGGVDKFRIKIWNKTTGSVIYDNQLGDSEESDATDAIEAGSIVIHQ